MEDFTTRTYGTSGLDNRPLFGETSAKVSAGVGPGPEGACPASLHPSGSCDRPGVDLGVERAGPAIRLRASRDVCPALVSKSRLEWGKKVQKVLGSLWEALHKSAETPLWREAPLRVAQLSFREHTSGVRLLLPPRAQGCF